MYGLGWGKRLRECQSLTYHHLELENMKTQIRGGMRQLARQGGYGGGPAPLGYDVVNKELIINEEESKIIKYIFQEYLNENGYLTIARMLNEKGIKTKTGSDFSANGIRFILMNKTYAGLIEWKDTEIETIVAQGQHQAIIHMETFDKVQARIASNPRTHLRNWTTSHLLSGLVKCEVCGASMSNWRTSSKGRVYHYYTCNQHQNKKVCKPNLIRKVETEETFKQEFKNIVSEKEIKDEIIARILEEQSESTLSDVVLENRKSDIRVLKSQQKNLIDSLSEKLSVEAKQAIIENINTISEKIKEIEEEIELELRIQREREKKQLTKRDISSILNNFDKFLDTIEELDARKLALTMIEKIETEDKKVSKIYTKFNKVYEVNNLNVVA